MEAGPPAARRKRPHPRDRMGVGYLQGCRPVTRESNPSDSLNQTSEISSNFLEILETLGAEVDGGHKAAHSHSGGEVTRQFFTKAGWTT